MDKTDRLLKKMIPDPIVQSGLDSFELPNLSGTKEKVQLRGFNIISDGTYIDITNGTGSIFRIKPTATETYLYGGATAGDDLYLYGSSANATGHIDILGGSSIIIDAATTTAIRASGASEMEVSPNTCLQFQSANYNGGKTTRLYDTATTDATETTIQTITLTADCMYSIETKVMGEKTDGAQNAYYHLDGCFFRDGAGNATQLGATTTITQVETDATWDCHFDVSGSTVLIKIIGAAGTAIKWKCVTTQIAVSTTV